MNLRHFCRIEKKSTALSADIHKDTANAARRAVSAAAQRDAADNDNDLWLCADGCTHHSDHLSVFLLAVQKHCQQS